MKETVSIFMEKIQVAGRYFSNGQGQRVTCLDILRNNHAQTANNNNLTPLFSCYYRHCRLSRRTSLGFPALEG
jgi:hypothetical protein